MGGLRPHEAGHESRGTGRREQSGALTRELLFRTPCPVTRTP